MKLSGLHLVVSCSLLLAAGGVTASAATVTYTFSAQVPTNNGPAPGNFVLTVPTFVTGTPQSQFTGSDFDSCSAPGTGACIAQFSIGVDPITNGPADNIGFGNDVCCFIYFFPNLSFTTPGTYTADPFHSAGTATLIVAASDVPEPSTFGLAGTAVLVGVFSLRRHRAYRTLRREERSRTA